MRVVLGQPTVVENVTGASGSLGVGRVARSAPDGYMLVLGTLGSNVINGAWMRLEAVGLEAAPSVLVKPPRVKASPCALECKWLETVQLNDIHGNPAPRFIAFGQVVGVHIDERFIRDGLLDTAA